MKYFSVSLLAFLITGCANFHTHYQCNIYYQDNSTTQKNINNDSFQILVNNFADIFKLKYSGDKFYDGKNFYIYYSHKYGITIFFIPSDFLIRINAGLKNKVVNDLLQELQKSLKTIPGLKIEIEEKQIPRPFFDSV
jgi:hypothetical protein